MSISKDAPTSFRLQQQAGRWRLVVELDDVEQAAGVLQRIGREGRISVPVEIFDGTTGEFRYLQAVQVGSDQGLALNPLPIRTPRRRSHMLAAIGLACVLILAIALWTWLAASNAEIAAEPAQPAAAAPSAPPATMADQSPPSPPANPLLDKVLPSPSCESGSQSQMGDDYIAILENGAQIAYQQAKVRRRGSLVTYTSNGLTTLYESAADRYRVVGLEFGDVKIQGPKLGR